MKRSHSQNLRKASLATTFTVILHKLTITVFVGVLMSGSSLADDKTTNTEHQAGSPTAQTKTDSKTSKVVAKVDPYAGYKQRIRAMNGKELKLEVAKIARLLETEADKEDSKFSEKLYEDYTEKLEICQTMIKNQTAQLKKENANDEDLILALHRKRIEIQQKNKQLLKELEALKKQEAAIIAENKRLEQEAKDKK